MQYLVPFGKLKDSIPVVVTGGQLKVDLAYDELITLIKRLLAGVAVDEAYYRATYPDVAEAIDAGAYRNAQHHFVEYGYFEARRPFAPQIDEAWYIQTNADVEEGLKNGTIQSALGHFLEHGYDEGRAPMPLS